MYLCFGVVTWTNPPGPVKTPVTIWNR